MKLLNSLLLATGLITATQAFIVEMFNDQDCTDSAGSRNVYDNTCAYTQGFSSYKITTYGGQFQQLTTYSAQACAGEETSQGCAQGINRMDMDTCYKSFNGNGASNALSSYSNAAPCPN